MIRNAQKEPPFQHALQFLAARFESLGISPDAGNGRDFAVERTVVLDDFIPGLPHGGTDVRREHGPIISSQPREGDFRDGNVGIGTANPQYKLAVNGNIGAQDIIVTNTGWPDYVFRPGYRLRPLSEVSQYIQANHHLPDIPTEAEVKQKGVSLGDIQAKLLAKVEELTLHLIEQEKENRELRRRAWSWKSGRTQSSGTGEAAR